MYTRRYKPKKSKTNSRRRHSQKTRNVKKGGKKL